ncbi:MAG: sensor histidine kinase [Candidatus Cryptobacteroides sp.]
MKKTGVAVIIHIFALLHALVALSCRLAGIEDELLLTILTMTMALLICMKRKRSVEYTAAGIIVVNIIGYLLGNAGAAFFSLFFSQQYIVNSLATFATTEILGWGLVGFFQIFKKDSGDSRQISSTYITWIIIAMVMIFVLRLGIILLFGGQRFSGDDMLVATKMILSNSVALVILICVNILCLRGASRFLARQSKILKFVEVMGFICVASFLEALSVKVGLPPVFTDVFNHQFIVLLIASFIAEITVFCIVYMVNEALTARAEMKRARDKANMAQYRYLKLKKQVNPHFLFNSLNVLNFLIIEEKTEQASTYTQKLASIYRYMLKSEDEVLVTLKEEMQFVEQYIDLILVRFPQGFDVNVSIPEKDYERFVLPCSIQLLVENATKHNAISPEKTLKIDIVSNGTDITISNNIIPKLTKSPSTGLGQKYIRQQYQDLSGREVHIGCENDVYKVTLPLL